MKTLTTTSKVPALIPTPDGQTPYYFEQASETREGITYTIHYQIKNRRWICSCPAGRAAMACKHLRAVQAVLEQRRAAKAQAREIVADALDKPNELESLKTQVAELAAKVDHLAQALDFVAKVQAIKAGKAEEQHTIRRLSACYAECDGYKVLVSEGEGCGCSCPTSENYRQCGHMRAVTRWLKQEQATSGEEIPLTLNGNRPLSLMR